MKKIIIVLLLGIVFSCTKDKNDEIIIQEWTSKYTEDGYWFEDIHISNNSIYVLGSTSSGFGKRTLVFKSTDNGNTWNKLSYNEDLAFSAIGFMDDKVGLMTGYRMISKTLDSGLHWDTASIGLLNFQSINTSVSGKIFACGTGLFVSLDTAKTWNSLLPGNYWYSDINYINNEIGFTGNHVGQIYKTNDGGENWQVINELNNTEIYKLTFINESKGVAIVGERSNATAYPDVSLIYTEDSGNTWSHLNLQKDGVILEPSSPFFIKSENEIYLGAVNGIFYSADFGNSWERQYASEDNFSWINDMDFIGNIGIATSANGEIIIYN